MDWIEKVLTASPLSVALLVCVILALIAYKLIALKKAAGSTDRGSSLWRLEQLENDVKELNDRVAEMLPRMAGAEAEMRGFGRILEMLQDTQQAILARVDKVLDHVGK